MGTIAEKLTYLDDTREQIKNGINSIGGELTSSDTFRSYATKLEDLYNSFPKVTGTGSVINLTPTGKGRIKSEIQGNTQQTGTPTPDTPIPINVVSGDNTINICGKNLLGLQENTYSSNGITASVSNGEITLNGTATANTFISLYTDNTINWVDSQTYTINAFNPILNSNVRIRLETSGSKDIILNPANKTAQIEYSEDLGLYTDRIQIRVQNGTTLTNFKLQPMLVKGTTAPTTYEPYQSQSYELDLGKNLANPENLHLGYSLSEQGALVSNNPARTTLYQITIEPNKQYNLSANANYQIGNLFYYDISKTFLSMQLSSYGSNKNITTPNNAYYISFVTRRSDNSTMTQNDLEALHLQIEKGDTVSSFAPYKTPIELCKIGTSQDFIKKGTGKNLLNYSTTGTGQDIDYNFNGSELSLNGTTSGSGQIAITSSQPITLQAGTYTFSSTTSGTFTANEKSTAIYLKKLSDNTTIITLAQNNSYTLTSSFTLTETTKVYVQVYTNGAGFVFDNFKIQWQIEKGSSATSYEPYGMYNKWYIEKQIDKVVLDGSESSWSYDATNSIFINNSSIINGQYAVQNGYSNYFKNIVNENITNNYYAGQNLQNGEYSFRLGTKDRLYLKNTAYTNTNDFKTWLSTHNTEVYYVLATPTYTEITDTELLNQLEAFYYAKSYDGQTNFTVTSADLPAILNVSALKKYE